MVAEKLNKVSCREYLFGVSRLFFVHEQWKRHPAMLISGM